MLRRFAVHEKEKLLNVYRRVTRTVATRGHYSKNVTCSVHQPSCSSPPPRGRDSPEPGNRLGSFNGKDFTAARQRSTAEARGTILESSSMGEPLQLLFAVLTALAITSMSRMLS